MQEQRENEERAQEIKKQAEKEKQESTATQEKTQAANSKQGTTQLSGRKHSPNAGASQVVTDRQTPQSVSSVSERGNARHPLLPKLHPDEEVLEEVAIKAKMDALCMHKINQCFLKKKQMLISRLQ